MGKDQEATYLQCYCVPSGPPQALHAQTTADPQQLAHVAGWPLSVLVLSHLYLQWVPAGPQQDNGSRVPYNTSVPNSGWCLGAGSICRLYNSREEHTNECEERSPSPRGWVEGVYLTSRLMRTLLQAYISTCPSWKAWYLLLT